MKSTSPFSSIRQPLRGLVLASSLLTSAVASNAVAEQPQSSSQTSAQLRYREAAEVFKQERWSEARRLFLALWNESKSYDVAVSLSQTEYQLGHYAAAAGYLQFVLQNIPPTEKVSAADEYRKALAALQPRTARLKIEVDQPAAELLLDGNSIGQSPRESELYVDPGHHQLEAHLGERKATKSLEVQAGALIPVKLTVGLAPTPHSDSAPPDYEPVIATISAGSVALVSSVVLLALASHKDSKREDLLGSLPGTNPCGPPNSNSETCYQISSYADDAKTFRAISIVGFGAAAVAGVATYFLWPRKPDRAQVGVRALVLPSTTGVNAFAGFDGTF